LEDKEILDFGKTCIGLLSPHVEKCLGPLPSYKIEVEECQIYDRSDVPFSISSGEEQVWFVFFRQGIRQSFLRRIQRGNNENRIEVTGYWIESLIHDLIHLYQGISLRKIDKDEMPNDYSNKYWPWLDGLAEYMAWKISLELYKNAETEGNYWRERKEIKDVLEAIKLKKYKLGIRKRIVNIAVKFIYPILLDKGLEEFFILPEFVPKDIKQEISAKIRKKEYGIILNPNLFLHYALGFVLIIRIIEKGRMNYKELLDNPKNVEELLELAQIIIKR
jgi:hypothetical protein